MPSFGMRRRVALVRTDVMEDQDGKNQRAIKVINVRFEVFTEVTEGRSLMGCNAMWFL
jgi:hypothetical protein